MKEKKKDYLVENQTTLRNFNDKKKQSIDNRHKEYQEKKQMVLEKKQAIEQKKHHKAIHNLVRWDEYRIRRDA